jgi:TrpR-related protein YerC/YecD
MHKPDAIWNAAARDLLKALLRLRTPAEARRFLRDLMTEDEIRMIVDRWHVARMLADGRSYKDIEAETHLSSRTIARISRWLKSGEGGYRLMLARSRRQSTPNREPAHHQRGG